MGALLPGCGTGLQNKSTVLTSSINRINNEQTSFVSAAGHVGVPRPPGAGRADLSVKPSQQRDEHGSILLL